MPRTPPSKAKLLEIAASIPTPFHLYDAAGIRSNAKRLREAFSWNPGYREYFAVKATPTPAIINLLKREGCGVDCASFTELKLAEACGLSGEFIMFSSNMTPAPEYQLARRLGAVVNLDDVSHVDFLQDCAGVPENISMRFNPGGHFTLGNTVMGAPGEAKFGMTRPQLDEAVAALKRRGAKRFALHAFLASNTTEDAYYPTMARTLFRTARELSDKHGVEFFMVNLSGGIGIPYRPNARSADIMWIGEAVRNVYDEIIKPMGMPVRIATELGRYMTGPYGWLVTSAIHKKEIHKNYIGLDACAADLMRPAMYGAYHHITVPGKEDLPLDHVYDVVGSLCENNDKFAVDRPLPRVDTGDLVVLHDTGAHGRSMGYNYNGKLRSAEVLLEKDGSFRMIRRAETIEDYFATTNGFV
ncbi:MAG: diaminopimelate decarboxylase [Oscillospiraceae bacterium]|jgi:diaminopimelate decarboxylase|nr:diaminopimelate decarboxylase [Oscillospiraceae bacterium]